MVGTIVLVVAIVLAVLLVTGYLGRVAVHRRGAVR